MQDIHSSMTNTTRDNLFAREVDQPPINNHHDNLKCPRCQSLNTKFCYYNNYNLSQPRHLCKSCRRYWTNGGILRNVPVGGGIRKTKPKPKPKRSGKLKTGAGMVVCNYSSSENFSSDCLNATRSNTSTTTNTTTMANNNNYSSSENFSSDCSGVTTNTTTANTTTTSDPSSVKPDMLVNFNELSAQMLCSPVGRFDMMLNQSQMNNDLQWTDMEMNMPEMRSSVMMNNDNNNNNNNNNNMGFENMKSDGQVVGKNDRRNIDGEDLYDLSGTVDEFYWCHNQWCGDDDDGDRGQLDCLT